MRVEGKMGKLGTGGGPTGRTGKCPQGEGTELLVWLANSCM